MGACYEGHLDVVRALCDRGAEVNATCTGEKYGEWFSALSLAARENHQLVISELCNRKADLNARDDETAFMLACRMGCLEAVQELYTRGADVSIPSRDQMTAFMIACEKGHLDVVRYLCDIEPGLMSATIMGGWTPLMYAVSWCRQDVICELLQRGADVNARETSTGKTALMVAGESSSSDMCILLLQHNADKNALDLQGHTAYFHSQGAEVWDPGDMEAYYVTQGILFIIPPLDL